MSRHAPHDPILIVGAGPVGLTLAAELARRGVFARVIDRAPERARGSRATDIHARTLEHFDALGIGDEVVARGKRVTRFTAYHRGRVISDLTLAGLRSRRPHAIALPQQETEGILERRLRALGGYVERGVSAEAITPAADGVTLTLRHADDRLERAHPRWLVGCDGVHSPVRAAAAIDFSGVTLAERYLVVDCELDWALDHDRVHLFTAPGGFVNVLAMPGDKNVRIMANLPAAAPRDHLAAITALLDQRTNVAATIARPTFTSTFKIAQRLAASYRRGPILLAGDAAHTWSPLLGQGMNVGLQDAFNLAWKLALVASRQAPPALLDSYEAERRPVARDVLGHTHAMHRMATMRGPLAHLRDHALGFVQRVPGFSDFAAATCSELATHYRASPIVARAASRTTTFTRPGALELGQLFGGAAPLRPGDRAPDPWVGDRHLHAHLGLGHTLLVFDPIGGANEVRVAQQAYLPTLADLSARFGDALAIVHVALSDLPRWHMRVPHRVLRVADGSAHRALSATTGALCLVRPDRHLAALTSPHAAGALVDCLARVFGSTAAPEGLSKNSATAGVRGVGRSLACAAYVEYAYALPSLPPCGPPASLDFSTALESLASQPLAQLG